jgi:fatty-acyl-CoA synthase
MLEGMTAVRGARPGLAATSRGNSALARRLGDFATLAQALDYAAKGDTGFNFYSPRGELADVLPYRVLRDRALTTARRLMGLGLARGARVAVVAETGADFLAIFFGCQHAGLVPCPVPHSIHIGGKDAYIARVGGMLAAARASLAIGPADLSDHIRQAASVAGIAAVITFDQLEALPESSQALRPFGADEVAYIQYSSGSTSDPKGVLISQAAITANARGILRDGLKVTPEDRGFSWLPLYHDMGLVGFCIAPMMGQVSIDYLATTAFARRPALWLKLMSDIGTTVAYAPSFGYELAARRINGEAKSLDLTRWRVAGIGGDMVRVDVLNLFTEKLAPAGFNPRAFVPSYGMAETTLAVTFSDTEAPVRVDTIDRAKAKLSGRAVPVAKDNAERVRSFVVCGRPLPGVEVEIRGEGGRVLGPREIGRIVTRGPSLMDGYFENAEATHAAIGDDGFLDTGDMGYWLDGEIVITGRAKDMILHNGRNIWPQDLEWAAERVEPLRAGDAAAFAVEGEDGEDDVVVLVQCRTLSLLEMEELRRAVAAAVHRSAGVECQIVLVPPRSLPFTSSGKLSRGAAKSRYLTGEIAEIARARSHDDEAHRVAAQ